MAVGKVLLAAFIIIVSLALSCVFEFLGEME